MQAQAPFTIVGVERKGLPPYEEGERLYRLDGGEGRGLRAGDRLMVRRSGAGTLGLLKVVESRAEWALAVLDGVPHEALMKGDLAVKAELAAIPQLPLLRNPDLPLPKGPTATAVEAPPQEGLLWFASDSSTLSPAGLAKLSGWVEAWGRDGQWKVVIGEAKGADAPRREARGHTLQEALQRLGVRAVTLELAARQAEGSNHPAWVQRRE